MTTETTRTLHELKLPGMAKSWVNNTLSSKAGITGILKKLGYLIMVAVAAVVDCDHGMTVLVTGAAGTGKSYFACALGDMACRQGKKVIYFTMNMLAENLRLARLEGKQTAFLRKISRHDLLIIDDFGMKMLEGDLQTDFEQIIDDRYGCRALVLASQLPVSEWYNLFQSELIAEACLDRLVHKSIRLELKGESLRKKY